MSLKTSAYKNQSSNKYEITDEKRELYRKISFESRQSKQKAENGLLQSIHNINIPVLNPLDLMPKIENNKFTSLSLFSGGGGLDLGLDRAGFKHISSYELIPICKETFNLNHPEWSVYCGPENGDVTKVDWKKYFGEIDVIHGGPPCQPFSIAGQQKGINDERNMWGEFIRAINIIKPKAFIAENVIGLLSPKFQSFVKNDIIDQLSEYYIIRFEMNTADYGIPQIRRRVFFIGFRNKKSFNNFKIPKATHSWKKFQKHCEKSLTLFEENLPETLGVRQALGLSDIGYDNLAPTIRSGFTGKRNTTSILNSTSGQKSWSDMNIWPNGVQASREKASSFPSNNGHFRLSVQDVALLQGFPETWEFGGAVYQILGQIGNSVSPPVAYNVAKNILNALI